MQFLSNLLKSAILTEDPLEAHLFFLPALTYAYTSNLGDPEFHVTRVAEYVQEHFPYWNRTGGRDHIVWVPGDRSSCYLRSNLSKAMIKLTHFGYFDHGAPMVLEDARHNRDWGCYHPLRDVVMSPYFADGGRWAADTFNNQSFAEQRPTMFFFSGGLRLDSPEYSGNTRQSIASYVDSWDSGEIKFVHGYVQDYRHELRSARFCLAPYGHGFGIRIVHAAVSGCIPVVIQEHVYQPFEDVLPYEEFSLRLNNADIHRLPDLLRAIGPERLAALQRGLQKYWPAFVWHTEEGGKAFEYAMLELRRRSLRFKGMYYGRHRADQFRRRQLDERL